jgi:hypothetical protein
MLQLNTNERERCGNEQMVLRANKSIFIAAISKRVTTRRVESLACEGDIILVDSIDGDSVVHSLVSVNDKNEIAIVLCNPSDVGKVVKNKSALCTLT